MNIKLSTASLTTPDKARVFAFKRKEWPDDDNRIKMKIDNPNGGASFSESLRVIDGTEHPELFLLWLQDYRQRIWDNPKIDIADKQDILLRLTKGEANSIADRALQQCRGRVSADGTSLETTSIVFRKHPLRAKVATFDAASWRTYLAPGGGHGEDQIKEAIHALKLEIFGNDIAGRNSYTRLKRQIRALRVDFTNGIRKWATRVEDFQSYLPDTLWEAGEKKGNQLVPFNEMELREILDGSLQKAHHNQLLNIDWDVLEKDYAETIAKLETLEAQIIQTNNQEKRLAALEGNDNSKSKSGPKRHQSKSPKNTSQANTERKPCKICGKMHKGKCWHSKNKSNEKSTDNRKRKWNQETLSVLKELLKAQKNADDDTSSDESETQPTWKKGLSKVEQAYVLGAAQTDQNTSDDDISIDSYTVGQYRKRYRKMNKKKRRN